MLLVLVIGFEGRSYFVNESAGFVEVCILLTKPSQDEILGFTLTFVVQASAGSACKLITIKIMDFDGYAVPSDNFHKEVIFF